MLLKRSLISNVRWGNGLCFDRSAGDGEKRQVYPPGEGERGAERPSKSGQGFFFL